MARNKMVRVSDEEYALLVKTRDLLQKEIVRRTIGWLPEKLKEWIRDDVGELPLGAVVGMGAATILERLEKE